MVILWPHFEDIIKIEKIFTIFQHISSLFSFNTSNVLINDGYKGSLRGDRKPSSAALPLQQSKRFSRQAGTSLK